MRAPPGQNGVEKKSSPGPELLTELHSVDDSLSIKTSFWDPNLVLGPKWSPGPGIDIYHTKAVDHHMQPGLLTPIVSDVGRRH